MISRVKSFKIQNANTLICSDDFLGADIRTAYIPGRKLIFASEYRVCNNLMSFAVLEFHAHFLEELILELTPY